MIAGLPLDYTHARVCARLAQRPDERVWQQARSARSAAALLEALRASPAAATVSGIEPRAAPDSIERAFRQRLRHLIGEVARWAPQPWQDAVLWTRHLIDLPALAQLLGGAPAAPWMLADPALAELARTAPAQRRALLADGELGAVARALAAPAEAAPSGLHVALAAWRDAWRARWPHCPAEERRALELLARDVERHLARFAAVPVELAHEARGALAARALRWLHRHPAQPVALFAYLLLAATDLERLRGEFAVRAVFAGVPP